MSDIDPLDTLKSIGWIHHRDEGEEIVLDPKQVAGIRLRHQPTTAPEPWEVELLLKSGNGEFFYFATEEERTDFVRFVSNLI